MKVKAIMGFSGERFSMYAGEVREVERTETVDELLRVGYLEPSEADEVQPEAEAQAADEAVPEKADEPKADEVKHENKRSRAKPD